MRKKLNWFIPVLALVLLLSGCGGNPSSSKAEILETGDARFLMVTLEGTDTASAQVEAIKAEKNSDGVYVHTQVIPLSPGEGDVHCAVLESGGEYYVQITRGDGSIINHLVVFDESQVCSLHICLDPKAETGIRSLWPETPHNSPDAE